MSFRIVGDVSLSSPFSPFPVITWHVRMGDKKGGDEIDYAKACHGMSMVVWGALKGSPEEGKRMGGIEVNW